MTLPDRGWKPLPLLQFFGGSGFQPRSSGLSFSTKIITTKSGKMKMKIVSIAISKKKRDPQDAG